MPISSLARAFVSAAAALFAVSVGAQIKALNYTTPSYIELEKTEVRAYEGTTAVTINVFRTGEFRVRTKVDFQTVEETASEGSDYKGAGGTLVFNPGEGFKSITLELLGDEEIEVEEAFQLKLSCSSPDVVIAAGSARIVIGDTPLPISNPALAIAPDENGQVRVSWRGSAESVLETSADPAAQEWIAVSCNIESSSGQCHALVPAAQALGFFRLRVR